MAAAGAAANNDGKELPSLHDLNKETVDLVKFPLLLLLLLLPLRCSILYSCNEGRNGMMNADDSEFLLR
jgi:hypothetical protein